ncbi:MAG TPA: 4-alpha-glucanotransferase [Acidimicrobiia bacterium]|nr:4-alpha-glucanotransferase [Acidimicrobiia bacterium]
MIERSYVDALGEEHLVSASTLDALQAAIGEPSDATTVIVHPGETPQLGPAEVVLEDGTTLVVEDRLPPDLPLGYHRMNGERDLIVSPGRCYLEEGVRRWGWAVQLYAARSAASWGMGDLADLRWIAEHAAASGAGLVLVNPLGAVAPIAAQAQSPYFPASRRYLNPLYLRVEEVPGATAATGLLEEAAAAGRALNRSSLIDRDEVWRLKSAALEAIWRSAPPPPEFEHWSGERGGSLDEFAAWCVLAEQHGGDWSRWPDDLIRPTTALRRVRAEYLDRLRYHQWLQWLCRRQLDHAARPLLLMQDLPIGVDPGGADAWVWQDMVARDVTIGAPPDEFNTRGQDWGLPPFVPHLLRNGGYRPFVETIRANLLTGGGLRIDHVMGLFRQFWIPSGAEPTEGAYVRFPHRDLLDIIALESTRAGAVVVGEDLGTVEEGVREELARRRVLSYRLLWFEPEAPRSWPVLSLASVSTHDLPTVAGLWSGADLQEQRELDLSPNEESTVKIRRLVAGLTRLDDDADLEEVVVGVHRQLAEAPSHLICATLEDLALSERRPNIPGTEQRSANWSLALPRPLEELMTGQLAEDLASIFNGAIRREKMSR